jgi:hypothetical protein
VGAGVAVALAVGTPARAQSPASVPAGAAPFAWIDDASVLPPGVVAVSVAMLRWQGSDLSEVNAPIVGVAAGWTPRVQISASIPRVIGDDVSGVVGGLGTTYVSAKIGIVTDEPPGLKVAVAPTLEVLGLGSLQSLAPGASRMQLGLPISVEVDRGTARVFGSAGFFTPGVWFAGGGIGAQATPRVAVSAAFSRAWTTDVIGGPIGDRREISGGVAFSPRRDLSFFGSIGRTIATSDQDGAGTTFTGGVLFLLSSSTFK